MGVAVSYPTSALPLDGQTGLRKQVIGVGLTSNQFHVAHDELQKLLREHHLWVPTALPELARLLGMTKRPRQTKQVPLRQKTSNHFEFVGFHLSNLNLRTHINPSY